MFLPGGLCQEGSLSGVSCQWVSVQGSRCPYGDPPFESENRVVRILLECFLVIFKVRKVCLYVRLSVRPFNNEWLLAK